ncbi:MAG: hypothetical protein ACRDFQ_09580 [Anaerolineales bacterium]
MNEAKASYNGYFRSPRGNKDQFTLRQTDEQSDKDFIARVKQFLKLLEQSGWTEWSAEEEGRAVAHETATRNGKSPTRSSERSSDQRTGQAFDVESIALAAGGDHPRWVVKGGNFKKFGVTCWPETLEAAGVAEKLDPLKENKPKGNWVARYTERQNDEGKWVPDKVIELEKVKP